MNANDNQWEDRLKQVDSIPKLKATIATQKETIALLKTQLNNERLKNGNLDAMVKANKSKDKRRKYG